jgi:hypothetical protein
MDVERARVGVVGAGLCVEDGIEVVGRSHGHSPSRVPHPDKQTMSRDMWHGSRVDYT